MTVADLVRELSKIDQTLDVVLQDEDAWKHSLSGVEVGLERVRDDDTPRRVALLW